MRAPLAEGRFRRLWPFLVSGRRWWLLPVVTALLVYVGLIVVSRTGAASFIYTLF